MLEIFEQSFPLVEKFPSKNAKFASENPHWGKFEKKIEIVMFSVEKFAAACRNSVKICNQNRNWNRQMLLAVVKVAEKFLLVLICTLWLKIWQT